MEENRFESFGGPGDGVAPPLLDRQRYTLRFRATLPSSRPAINEGVARVLALVDEVGYFGAARADLEIALREALANAIIHGNKNHAQKQVRLRCYGAPEGGLIVVVRDEGDGFDPDEIPDPRKAERVFLDHGRGIFLMRELMDHVHHRKGGREVVLYKSCQGDDARNPEPDER